MHRDNLISFLDDYLRVDDFNDDCPNGLQVEGKSTINTVITGVSASVRLFEEAIKQRADAIIVHHGIIWNFARPLYRGGYKERVRLLLEHQINLLAYHLPLDAHEKIGNNARLGSLLDLQNISTFGQYKGQLVGVKGETGGIDKKRFFTRIRDIVKREPLIFDYGPDMINTVGIVSGGAQKDISQAVSAGLDLFLTGEVSEHNLWYAQEEGIHFVSAGHYATEKFGVIALGELLEKEFKINTAFIDVFNPV